MAPTIPRQPELLVQLRQTQHAVRTLLDGELAASGLTTPQYTVLAAVERDRELSASDLAREFGMTAQTVNVLVRALEACGLVRRTRHPGHGRIMLVTLTARGRRALRHGREMAMSVQDRLIEGLTSSDRSRLMNLLKRVEESSSRNAESR